MTPPLDFYCAFHLHQPVGNFGHVIAEHVQKVYRPLIDHMGARSQWPIVVHVSGALLEWCERNDRAFIDDLAQLASEGRVEFLLAGFYEPILASLPVHDRLVQIRWMREWLQEHMGVDGSGLWLTERVWEPDLARDLADAGVKYALVDDRPFLVSGHAHDTLSSVFRTEHDGRLLDLVPIDERLRYLIPFRPVQEIVAHFRAERAAGRRIAVFADDGEKFGGWPKTHEWVFGSGWIDEFLDTLIDLQEQGEIRLVKGPDLLSDAPRGGIAYLGNGSYREMEQWSLPPELGARFLELEKEIGEARMAGPDGAFIRGAHWKHFLVKYPEANRAHKHMLALSRLCVAAGDPDTVSRDIGRAQSNDSLWHGVFGGLYLPWLRESVWTHLARAEQALRKGQGLQVEQLDIDADGTEEFWIHSAHTSVVLAPHRGGAVETWMRLDYTDNAADVLTRRVESYHYAAVRKHARRTQDTHARLSDGAASIHDLEHQSTLTSLPPADLDVRALAQVRIVDASITEQSWRDARYIPIRNFASAEMIGSVVSRDEQTVSVLCTTNGFESTVHVHAGGDVEFEYKWESVGLPIDALVAVEVSLSPLVPLEPACEGARISWHAPIETLAKSERGLERTVQGHATLFLVPVSQLGTSLKFRARDARKPVDVEVPEAIV